MAKTRAELRGTGHRISSWLAAALAAVGQEAEDLCSAVTSLDSAGDQRAESLQRSIANYLNGTDIPMPRTARLLGKALEGMGHPYVSELSATVAAGHLSTFVLCLRWIAAKERVYGDEHAPRNARARRGNLLAAILCDYVPLAVEADIASATLPELFSNDVLEEQAAQNEALLDELPIERYTESDAETMRAARHYSGAYYKRFKSEIREALDRAESRTFPPITETDELWDRGLRMGVAVQSLVDAGPANFEDKLDLIWVALPVWANALRGRDSMHDQRITETLYHLRAQMRAFS